MADRNQDGTFAPGNELWAKRNFPGRNPAYASPQDLYDKCIEYFQWADNTPFAGKKRPYTQISLCQFLGITTETWNQYKNKPVFSEIKAVIDASIYDQKFIGATVGLFQHQIIARDLGLLDRQQIDINDVSEQSEDQLKAKLAAMLGNKDE